MPNRATGSPPYRLRFTEEMKGWFAPGETDFKLGEQKGRESGAALMFHLTIATDDVYRFINDREHTAVARGWVQSPVLGGRLPVNRGIFNLFVTESAHARRMLYRLFFEDSRGQLLTLSGFKQINGGWMGEVWPETSTLFTSVLEGHVDESAEESAVIVARGILHILPLDFARQLTTFRVYGQSVVGRLRALIAFGRLFIGQLFVVFAPRETSVTPRV